MNEDLPTVTVIMPVYNEAAYIRNSLGAVLNQNYCHELLEILVVDGGSEDETREIAAELLRDRLTGKILDNPHRIQAAALNIGIVAATGDVIIRVDGHTIIAPDYVSTCVDFLRQGKAENVGGLMRPLGTTYAGQGIALATTSPFGIGGSKFHYSDREQVVDTVYLGAYWRTTFDEIGLYDEAVNINEDYELNYRLRQAGGRILLSPAIKSTYTPRSSLPALGRQYFIYGRQKVRTLQKHPASLRWRQIVAPLFVLILGGTFLLSFFSTAALGLFVLALGSYLLANLVASTIAVSANNWRYWPILPLIFATIHFSWGSGFIYGLASSFFKEIQS